MPDRKGNSYRGRDSYRPSNNTRPSYRSSSTSTSRHGNNRSSSVSAASAARITVSEALKTDRILPIDQFVSSEKLRGTDEEIISLYSEYIKKHQKSYLHSLYNRHKKETWFNELLTLKEQEQDISSSSYINDSITNIDFDAENSNLLYKEEYNFKRREDDINEGSSESYILPIETSVPTSMSKLLPEFDQQIITISNIPPYIDRAILEGHINEPISKLDLTAPNADKGYYRLGWLKLEDNSSEKVTEFITKLESLGSIEGAKLYFGVASSGFRRFRVTCYPAGDKEEEEQKSLALQLIYVLESKPAEPETEFNNFGLDQLIFYLRKVHNFCFYCCQKFTSSQELLFKCGDLHLRRGIDVATSSSSSASENVKRDFERLIDKIRSTLNFVKVLKQQHQEKEVNEEEEEARINEILSETSISKIEEGKYRCIHCLKAFKGPEFVLKHLHLKHEDIILRTKEELADFSKLLRNAPMWLFPTSMLPRHSKPKSHGKEPSSGRKASTSSSSSSKRNQSTSTSNYVDWDASKSSSMEISYDLEY